MLLKLVELSELLVSQLLLVLVVQHKTAVTCATTNDCNRTKQHVMCNSKVRHDNLQPNFVSYPCVLLFLEFSENLSNLVKEDHANFAKDEHKSYITLQKTNMFQCKLMVKNDDKTPWEQFDCRVLRHDAVQNQHPDWPMFIFCFFSLRKIADPMQSHVSHHGGFPSAAQSASFGAFFKEHLSWLREKEKGTCPWRNQTMLDPSRDFLSWVLACCWGTNQNMLPHVRMDAV